MAFKVLLTYQNTSTIKARVKTEMIKDGKRTEFVEARRSPRIRLQVPVFIRGTDAAGSEFIELTKTLNISATGACITSGHLLRHDQTLYLTIPAPSPSSPSMVPSETPPLIAKVLRQDSSGDTRLYGLEFLRPLE